MKYYLGLFALLSLLLTSCKEEVDLTGDFKETVVVHGILDKSDSIHFIKITRAFIGPGNAVEIAANPDSSYFTNMVATVTELVNGSQTRQWTLKDTLVDTKDTNGVWYAPQQKLYYFETITTADLNPNAVYQININVNDGEYIVTGATELVSGVSSTVTQQNFRFKFADNPGEYVTQGLTASNVGKSYKMSCRLLINIYEYTSANDSTLLTIPWNLGEKEVTPNTAETYTAVGQTFYNIVKAGVTNNPNIIKRRLHSITSKFTGAAEDLVNYMSVSEPSSSLAQTKPTFTNLTMEGDGRVVGIWSSRQTFSFEKIIVIDPASTYRGMDVKSTAELCSGPITGLLFFCSNHNGDMAQTWFCN